MRYVQIKNGVVKNIISCDNDEVAKQFSAVPWYEGAEIGELFINGE